MARPRIPDAFEEASATGLRESKKARCREDILRVAADLFERQGFDETTLADIARNAGISPPTVANYFGSKENILSALIFEGAEFERSRHLHAPRRTNCPFSEVMGALLCGCTDSTMRIVGKRVWRYAEAVAILKPGTEFQRNFSDNDAELRNLLRACLDDYDVVLRNRAEPDTAFLAKLFFQLWTALYFDYIRDDTMTLEGHKAALRAETGVLVSLLFEDGFAAKSPLKQKKETS